MAVSRKQNLTTKF